MKMGRNCIQTSYNNGYRTFRTNGYLQFVFFVFILFHNKDLAIDSVLRLSQLILPISSWTPSQFLTPQLRRLGSPSSRGISVSIPSQFVRDSWWTKWQRNRFFFRFLPFSLDNHHHCTIFIWLPPKVCDTPGQAPHHILCLNLGHFATYEVRSSLPPSNPNMRSTARSTHKYLMTSNTSVIHSVVCLTTGP
jgi:hypothetical protein